MKRTLLFSSLSLFLITSGVFPQGMMMSPEERAKRLQERLALDDDQTMDVQKIYEASQKDMREAMEAHMGDRDAMRKAMTDQMEKVDKKIEKLLTKEQKKKYEELKKERRQMQRPRGSDERRESPKKSQ